MITLLKHICQLLVKYMFKLYNKSLCVIDQYLNNNGFVLNCYK